VGFCGIFKHFSGFEFFLLPSIVHARPHAGNANRWHAGSVRNKIKRWAFSRRTKNHKKEIKMSMKIVVKWSSGTPCSGVRVTAWVNDEGNTEVITNGNGEAYFQYGPGTGTIYCDGMRVGYENRSLSSTEYITCEERNGGYVYY
jgi:hypothetical protein